MPLNEADTRAQLIDPKLNIAGWTHSQVTREHYYGADWAYTAGKIILLCKQIIGLGTRVDPDSGKLYEVQRRLLVKSRLAG